MNVQIDQALAQPVFDALTVGLTAAAADGVMAVRAALARAVATVLQDGADDWDVRPVHASRLDEYDCVPPADAIIAIGQAFELKYALEQQAEIAFAEALFETNLDNIPELAAAADEPPAADAAEDTRSIDAVAGLLHTSWEELTAAERDPGWPHAVVGTFKAWQLSQGAGIRVGHPDSGYIAHRELDPARILRALERDFYGDGTHGDEDAQNPAEQGGNHGLGTASVILSGEDKLSPDRYVVGVAPEAELVPLRITRKGAPVFFSRSGPRRVRDAIYYAVENGCHVISMSLGGPGVPTLRRAIQHAVDNNVIVIAAAGNVVRIVVWPARYPETIAVAASTASHERWFHSSRGGTVDITAPGHNVWRAFIDEDGQTEDVAWSSGTSFATAMTAGAAALWLAHHGRDKLIAKYPGFRLNDIFRSVLQASSSAPPLDHGGQFGAGIINIERLLNWPLPDLSSRDVIGDSRAVAAAEPASGADQIAAVFDGAPAGHVRGALAAVLNTDTSELDDRIAGVEDELLFHCVTNPALRRALAEDADVATRGMAEAARTVDTARSLYSGLAESAAVSGRLRARLADAPPEDVPDTAADAPAPIVLPEPVVIDPTGGGPTTPTLYALLVGIDAYPSPVNPLRGCVNDVRHFEDFLTSRLGEEGDVKRLSLLTLTDDQAKRRAIIKAWREHLGQAGADDVALFYFVGHGSQAPSPPEFWRFEPDRLDETLVCWDSRTADWDLADKELAQLIADVSRKQPHIVVVLDCCHSGSGTRAPAEEAADAPTVRRLKTDARLRTIDDFIVTPEQVESATADGNWVALPRGRHVVFSACRAEELAKEIPLGGEPRGVFSYFLLESLQRRGRLMTYRDVFKRTNALVRARVSQQSPLMEAVVATDLDQPFLGGVVDAGTPYFTVSHSATDGWSIDGGLVHGLPPARGSETVWLNIFPNTIDNDALDDETRAIGFARVKSVGVGQSPVSLALSDGAEPDSTETYKAVISATPLEPLVVAVRGDADGVALLRTALATAGPGDAPSLFVREADASAGEEAPYVVVAVDGRYRIRRIEDAFNLVVETVGYTAQNALTVTQQLEHIARWQTMAQLSNPSSRLPQDAVSLRVTSPHTLAADADGPAVTDAGLTIAYHREGDEWQEPAIEITVHNNSDRRLFFNLFFLSQAYAIVPAVADKLEPGQSLTFPATTSIPEALWQQGIQQFTDTIKVVAGTEEFDGSLAKQGELPLFPIGHRGESDGTAPKNALEYLLARVQQRTITLGGPARTPDWTTQEVTLTTVRLGADVELDPARDGATRLNQRVTVRPHPQLKATARLVTQTVAARGVGNLAVPAVFRDATDAIAPLDLSGSGETRSGEPPQNVLELANVADHTVVTAEAPLQIELEGGVAPGELVLPYALDEDPESGEQFFLPLGFARTEEGDSGARTVITLNRLPAPLATGTRAVGHAIRVTFQKLVGRRLGLEYNYPQLGIPSVAEDGSVRYETNETVVAQAVAAADKILLYVHGIFDNTNVLAGSAFPDRVDLPGISGLADRYDLILTYDYESIDTSIKDNGRTLAEQLGRVGFDAQDNKTLHIVAHSMGGLVSRWMIERAGGHAFVDHLLAVGSPHGGSPWPTIQTLATVGIGMALNGLSTVAWPLRVVGGALQAFEKIDEPLDQMSPDSEFLQTLRASDDPHVPYTLISGDTSLIANTAPAAQGPVRGRLGSFLRRLRLGDVSRQAATWVGFFGEPNDLAVSVASARAVPAGRQPAATIAETIGCDHVSFFKTTLGVSTIGRELPAPGAGDNQPS